MFKFYLSKFILSILLIFSTWTQAETSFSQVFVFGDSLSDTGNLASISNDFPFPYYMNRVSNGPVAVETLAAKLGLSVDASLHLLSLNEGSNYAVARGNAYGDEIFDLGTQLYGFYANHGFVAPADALYVLFIGGNDVRDAALLEPDLAVAQSLVKAAAMEVRHAIESLTQAGARSFLLVNAPNISVIPETRFYASGNPSLIDRALLLSELYKELLHDTAEQLEANSHINISEFDLFKFFNKLLKKADKYGFSNATEACFSTLIYQDEEAPFHPDCNYGMNFDQFIFFDEIHPTRTGP